MSNPWANYPPCPSCGARADHPCGDMRTARRDDFGNIITAALITHPHPDRLELVREAMRRMVAEQEGPPVIEG